MDVRVFFSTRMRNEDVLSLVISSGVVYRLKNTCFQKPCSREEPQVFLFCQHKYLWTPCHNLIHSFKWAEQLHLLSVYIALRKIQLSKWPLLTKKSLFYIRVLCIGIVGSKLGFMCFLLLSRYLIEQRSLAFLLLKTRR